MGETMPASKYNSGRARNARASGMCPRRSAENQPLQRIGIPALYRLTAVMRLLLIGQEAYAGCSRAWGPRRDAELRAMSGCYGNRSLCATVGLTPWSRGVCGQCPA